MPGKEKQIIRIVKKKKGHVAHHGGSWKVAYADFVTAMMAFFMVMWLLSMDQKMKDAIEGYFSNPVGFKKGFCASS
jgi:chemotaxis protein MotB